MVRPAMATDPAPETVSFGFDSVPSAEKAGRVRDVFDRVALRYDLMNDLMSAGMHRLWKAAMADAVNPQPGEIILDLAGGTGDIARRMKKRMAAAGRRRSADPGVVLVTDINEEMLTAGRARGEAGLLWAAADAEKLPFPDRFCNAVTIAFGIRNVTHIPNVLTEARRVLKPGGRFACLEFSKVAIGALEPAYDAFSFQVIPRIGRVIANDEPAYRYLVESIRRFPDQQKFAAMIGSAGFSRVSYRNFTAGVAALHMGWAV
jgi:demethylmenaquinone methyltransferase / 2-methoxy-6-polyprenyl-1,4-benzoquinol methylase